METGNIDHEQIKVEDAKTACVKIGAVVGRYSCDWTLDVVIDNIVYKGLEVCYHCQSEKEFTPKKAFDLFDYGTLVFVLCSTKKDGSIERKVFGLVPVGDDPYPKLCGLKRFFAKVQQIGPDGYPLWEGFALDIPVCKYYWIFFDDDGTVRVEEVKDASFQSIKATEILDRVTDLPKGSNCAFTKSFMLENKSKKCFERYVAEQHLLLEDRKIIFDAGADYPQTLCTHDLIPLDSPPNRFQCNVTTGDMVWYTIQQEDCVMFMGNILHINLEDGSVEEHHTYDFASQTNGFNPPASEMDGVNDWRIVLIEDHAIYDAPFDIMPEVTNIEGNIISGYLYYQGRPVTFTFNVFTHESHWAGNANSQDAEHVLWTEKGFELVHSWHFDQTINPVELDHHIYDWSDDGEYGPNGDFLHDQVCLDLADICRSYTWYNQNDCEGCKAKCNHCMSIHRAYHEEWTQQDNGESHVSFSALANSGHVDNWWNAVQSEELSHQAVFIHCSHLESDSGDKCWCDFGVHGNYEDFFGGDRWGDRDYKDKQSDSYKMAWVAPNCVYIETSLKRAYYNRNVTFKTARLAEADDMYGWGHCGGPDPDDFNKWTKLSGECLQCVSGVPDFRRPFLDLDGWPDWPDGYTQNIWNGDGYLNFSRIICKDDLQEPYERKFDMGEGITFDATVYEMPYYLDDRTSDPSGGLVIAAKGYKDYANAAGSSHWQIYHNGIDVTDKVLEALNCDPAILVSIGMV